MWIFDAIGDVCTWLADLGRLAYNYCSGIPILGGALEGFFSTAYSFFDSMALKFYDLGKWADEVMDKLGDILSKDTIYRIFDYTRDLLNNSINAVWNSLTGRINELWSYITNHFAELWRYTTEHVAELWNRINDFVVPTIDWTIGGIMDISHWINNFSTHAFDAIGQWLSENLFQWLKDRSAQVVNTAGSILEAVW